MKTWGKGLFPAFVLIVIWASPGWTQEEVGFEYSLESDRTGSYVVIRNLLSEELTCRWQAQAGRPGDPFSATSVRGTAQLAPVSDRDPRSGVFRTKAGNLPDGVRLSALRVTCQTREQQRGGGQVIPPREVRGRERSRGVIGSPVGEPGGRGGAGKAN